MIRSHLLTSAISLAALGLVAGCQVDDSMPTRPRTANFLTPDEKAQQNAEQRSLEKPGRELPTNRTDLPGQSTGPAVEPTVVTLDAAPSSPTYNVLGYTGPKGWKAFGHSTEPPITHTRDTYPGLVPHLPPDPGTVPMTGATPIPGGEFAVDHSWGQGLTLTELPHRNWPTTTATYQTADLTHYPVYYLNLQEHLPVKQNDGTYRGDVRSTLYEIPWFFVNTLGMPLLMALEPPNAHRTTPVPTPDPNFNGHLPEGPTVPAPTIGTLKWDYPFLNPDGSVKQTGESASTTTAPK